MPKTNIISHARKDDHGKQANENLRLIVASRMMRDRRTQKSIAVAIGIEPVTLSRRLSNPSSFSLFELRALFSELHFTDAEIKKCI